jgi:hypothetical protein
MVLVAVILIAINAPGHFTYIFTVEAFPMAIFWLVAIVIAIFTFIRKFSLIPVLGLISCFYLMAQESHTNWFRFLIWLAVGLVVYFLYGYRNSKLRKRMEAQKFEN